MRKQERRAFLKACGTSPLTQTKYLWSRGDEHMTTEQRRRSRSCTRSGSRSVARGRSRSRCARSGRIARAPPCAASSTAGTAGPFAQRLEPVTRVTSATQRHLEDVQAPLSPDGSSLAFVSTRDTGSTDIHVLDVKSRRSANKSTGVPQLLAGAVHVH